MSIIYDVAFDEDNHDMFLDGSDIAFVDENDRVKQALKIKLQFILAEWFLDNTIGIPYTQVIFKQGTSIEDIYSIFKNKIIETNGVEKLNDLLLTPDVDNKGMRVDFDVNDGVTGTVEVP